MADTFLTIAAPSEGIYKEKGSKFIALAFPVHSIEEVRERLQQVKQQYSDARHHCYAFMIGPRKQHYRSSDAGEPAHTAGTPILGQIRSRELTNVLVVVVRYFGGTKLGVPGLIAAYKAAAADALNQAQVIEQEETARLEVTFPYAALSQVMRLLKEYHAQLQQTDYQNSCRIVLTATRSNAAPLQTELAKLENSGVNLQQL